MKRYTMGYEGVYKRIYKEGQGFKGSSDLSSVLLSTVVLAENQWPSTAFRPTRSPSDSKSARGGMGVRGNEK